MRHSHEYAYVARVCRRIGTQPPPSRLVYVYDLWIGPHYRAKRHYLMLLLYMRSILVVVLLCTAAVSYQSQDAPYQGVQQHTKLLAKIIMVLTLGCSTAGRYNQCATSTNSLQQARGTDIAILLLSLGPRFTSTDSATTEHSDLERERHSCCCCCRCPSR